MGPLQRMQRVLEIVDINGGKSFTRRKARSLKTEFYRGEITASEFEREFSGQNTALKVIVRDVRGIGKHTSEAIAEEYEDLADLQGTDRERLESVRGVGPVMAEKVLDRVQ